MKGVPATFTNPVCPRDTPDPFVLKYLGSYWCYCTGWSSANSCFPIFTSIDLVHWKEHGGAMRPLPDGYPEYWAPEVSYREGKFYLYYSVGDGSSMHIRVAVADQPGGPFEDCGVRLTSQDFAIDPHVFADDDGSCWFFYATDFLEHSHIGTGTVRDRLLDPFTLAGKPSPVVRAQYDWQLFDTERLEKGGVRWHTVEGPTVMKHKGIYYEMFSGGNWKDDTYGVGYAFSSKVSEEVEWTQVCDGVHVHPVLRTVAGVTGPGHNSVVRGPDNRQLYCIYHRWSDDRTARLMAIDRLDWAGRELFVSGPTNSPQPYPNLPRAHPSFSPSCTDGPGPDWQTFSGRWSSIDGNATQRSKGGYCETQYRGLLQSSLIECSVRALNSEAKGLVGLSFRTSSGEHILVALSHGEQLQVLQYAHLDKVGEPCPVPGFRLIRVEIAKRILRISNGPACRTIALTGTPDSVGLFTYGLEAEFSAFSLTQGWSDTFEDASEGISDLSLHPERGSWKVESMQLRHQGEPGAIFKSVPSDPYEFVVNVRAGTAPRGFYGFFPAASFTERGGLVAIVSRSERWSVVVDPTGQGQVGSAVLIAELPEAFDPYRYQQFSFVVAGSSLSVRWRGHLLAETPIQAGATRVGLFASGDMFFDMLRVTQLTLS